MVVFALVSAVIMVTPGPSNVFLLAHGVGHGRRAAFAAVIGVETASAIRVVLTAAGLSALLSSSAVAFSLIRWSGVAYLTYLGIRAFRGQHKEQAASPPSPGLPAGRSARKGLIVGLANPKMVLFFIAFFPQFIHPGDGPEADQMLILGAIFWIIGVAWDLTLASASGTVGNWMHHRPRIHAAQPRIEGIAYLGLAGWAALSGGHTDH
jgi:threonine/homoserine/homoserine lactone efflux protein